MSDDEDELDAFADRDEEPRTATGYSAPPPRAAAMVDRPTWATRGTCRGYCAADPAKRDEVVTLYPTPEDPERTRCATCSGLMFSAKVERTREVIRALKAAAAIGHAEDERALFKQLTGLVGLQQATATASAIRAALEDGGGKGGRR